MQTTLCYFLDIHEEVCPFAVAQSKLCSTAAVQHGEHSAVGPETMLLSFCFLFLHTPQYRPNHRLHSNEI